jgi:hypothetical protein
MNTQLLYAGIPLAAAALPWLYDKARRFTAWMLAIAAAMVTVAVPVWVATLAATTATKKGAIAFLIIFAVFAWCFWMEAVRRPGGGVARRFIAVLRGGKPKGGKSHYNRIRTMVVAAGFGTCSVVAYAEARRLLHVASKTPAVAAQGFGASSAWIRSGKAAKALPPAEVHHVLLYGLLAFALLAVLLMLAKRKPKPARKRAAGKAAGKGKTPRAITAGD